MRQPGKLWRLSLPGRIDITFYKETAVALFLYVTAVGPDFIRFRKLPGKSVPLGGKSSKPSRKQQDMRWEEMFAHRCWGLWELGKIQQWRGFSTFPQAFHQRGSPSGAHVAVELYYNTFERNLQGNSANIFTFLFQPRDFMSFLLCKLMYKRPGILWLSTKSCVHKNTHG